MIGKHLQYVILLPGTKTVLLPSYTEVQETIKNIIQIGLATSKDGFNFERYHGNPVLKPTADNFDGDVAKIRGLLNMGIFSILPMPIAPLRQDVIGKKTII